MKERVGDTQFEKKMCKNVHKCAKPCKKNVQKRAAKVKMIKKRSSQGF